MRVAIIGAGIIGLYLAWKLAEKGHSVIVFEKKEKIGKEACSGLFSERILEFIPESQKLIQNEINYCLIHWGPLQRDSDPPSTLPKFRLGPSGGGWVGVPKRTLKIKFSKKFFVINHFELDNLVANLAEGAGAKIILNYNITRSVLATLQNKFDRVIGCDGANSIVRKSLGLKDPQIRLGIQGFLNSQISTNFTNIRDICAQISADSRVVETWPTRNGFIWKIPRGSVTEYGIIEDPKGAKLLFQKFLGENNLQLENLKSALIPQGLIIPQNNKITLCGDAAGLTKPWSGGGVVWSLIAANLLLKNFPDFLKYQKAIKKFFLPKIIFSKMATKIVYFLGYQMPWFLPKESKIDGDFLIF